MNLPFIHLTQLLPSFSICLQILSHVCPFLSILLSLPLVKLSFFLLDFWNILLTGLHAFSLSHTSHPPYTATESVFLKHRFVYILSIQRPLETSWLQQQKNLSSNFLIWSVILRVANIYVILTKYWEHSNLFLHIEWFLLQTFEVVVIILILHMRKLRWGRFNNFLKTTQLVNWRNGIQMLAVWLQHPWS